MKANWKLASIAILAACLLTGCPFTVKNLVGTAKLIDNENGRETTKTLSKGSSISDDSFGYGAIKTVELCEGSSLELQQQVKGSFPTSYRATTMVGPGKWQQNARGDGWFKLPDPPDCDDSDDDQQDEQDDENEDDRDDNDNNNDRDDEKDQDQERSQEERKQSDSDTQDTGSNENTSTDGSQGGNTGNGTTGTGGGAGGNTILAVSTSTFTVGGCLIAAAIIARELNDDTNDESISE